MGYLLDRLPMACVELQSSIFIDWGTGPGTYLVAWALFSLEKTAQLFGIDRSSLMLKQAQKIWTDLVQGK